MTTRPNYEYRVSWRREHWAPSSGGRRLYQMVDAANRFARRLHENPDIEAITISRRQVGPWEETQ